MVWRKFFQLGNSWRDMWYELRKKVAPNSDTALLKGLICFALRYHHQFVEFYEMEREKFER